MPAATNFLTPVRLATPGPSVQTILARRPFFWLIISAALGRRVEVSGHAAGRGRLAPEEVELRSPAIRSVSQGSAAHSIHSAIASDEPEFVGQLERRRPPGALVECAGSGADSEGNADQ